MIGGHLAPGTEFTTGSLAQGLSQGIDVAYGRRLAVRRGRVIVFMSDGELQEGQLTPRRSIGWPSNATVFFALTGDLSIACEVDQFARAYPGRFVNLGMAEQNLMGFAAGLTREGSLTNTHRRPLSLAVPKNGWTSSPPPLPQAW